MKKPILYLIMAIAAAVVLLVIAGCQSQAPATVTFFDVGQGDALLIQQGENQILIDGGPSRVIVDKLGETMPYYDRDLEVVILTHADSDHFAGLIDVFERYQVKTFVWTGALNEGRDFDLFMERLREEGAEEDIAAAGDQYEIGSARLEVLYPFEPNEFRGKLPKDLNETSVVTRLESPQVSMILPGDAGFEVEDKLLRQKINLKAEILKAGHHGSKNSTGEDWLKAVAPREIVFSVGEKNRFGHPARDTVRRVETAGIVIRRTDQEGDIMVDLE